MYEAPTLVTCDATEAVLPLHLRCLTFSLELVDVVRLVVEDHQLRQIHEILQSVPSGIAPIQDLERVARRAARSQRKHGVDDGRRVGQTSWCHHFGLLSLQQVNVRIQQQMPIGDCQQAVSGRLEADVVLGAHVAAHEREYGLTVSVRNEELSLSRQVGSGEVPGRSSASGNEPTAERVQQPVIDDQTWSDHHEVARKTGVVPPFREGGVLVQELPDERGLKHPGLSRARCHLEAVLGVRVLVLRDLEQSRSRQQAIRSDAFVELAQ